MRINYRKYNLHQMNECIIEYMIMNENGMHFRLGNISVGNNATKARTRAQVDYQH